MANHKSALKRIRQTEKRRLRNRLHRGQMRTQIRKFRDAVDAGDADSAKDELMKAVALINRTKSHGVIPRNTASRKVSRLTMAYNKMQAAN